MTQCITCAQKLIGWWTASSVARDKVLSALVWILQLLPSGACC